MKLVTIYANDKCKFTFYLNTLVLGKTITNIFMVQTFEAFFAFPPPPKCHHMSFVDFVVLPPGHGRSVTDF
jgi:hypothetical protein